MAGCRNGSVGRGGYAPGDPRDQAPTSDSFKTNSSSRDQMPLASADTCIHAHMYTHTSFQRMKAVIRMSLALLLLFPSRRWCDNETHWLWVSAETGQILAAAPTPCTLTTGRNLHKLRLKSSSCGVARGEAAGDRVSMPWYAPYATGSPQHSMLLHGPSPPGVGGGWDPSSFSHTLTHSYTQH